jgi:hypothetical protein
VCVEDALPHAGVLVLEDWNVFGAEAVTDAVPGGCGFAFFGLRTFGFGSVAARDFGSDAWVDHGVVLLVSLVFPDEFRFACSALRSK